MRLSLLLALDVALHSSESRNDGREARIFAGHGCARREIGGQIREEGRGGASNSLSLCGTNKGSWDYHAQAEEYNGRRSDPTNRSWQYGLEVVRGREN